MKTNSRFLTTMRRLSPLLFGVCLLSSAQAQTVSQWSTFAGTDGGYGNADGTGSVARFANPDGVAVDGSGNVYVADTGNSTIRRITSAGVVTTLAGTPGVSGSADGTGSAARFSGPQNVAVDGGGNVYVGDTFNQTIRKITPAGVVTTLAGSPGVAGHVDGTGSIAQFNYPSGIAVDGSGNVYVTEIYGTTVRKITSAGVVTTLAGGLAGLGQVDGTGSAARFTSLQGVAVDGSGNVYVADDASPSEENFCSTIRKITPAGVVTTLAGSSTQGGSVDGTGSAARFYSLHGVAVDGSGNVYAADIWGDNIRKITPAGVVTTFAGSLGRGSADGTGSAAGFWGPQGVAVDGNGNLYVGDTFNNTIRQITSAGVVTTLAGSSTQGWTDGTGGDARFISPNGMALDGIGNLYVADDCTIRKITSAGVVTTLAGSPGIIGSADGTGSDARFTVPKGVAVDGSGNVYVADSWNQTIRKITSAGVVTTLAGSPGVSGFADGTGSGARFSYPSGLAADGSGNVYVADSQNKTIRKITSAGVVTTLAGTPGALGTANGTGSAARFIAPSGIAVDGSGNVYVADRSTIRKITPAGVVTNLAGTPMVSGSADGNGGAAQFSHPNGIAVDGSGVVYVLDFSNNPTIRTITPAGVVNTFGPSSPSSEVPHGGLGIVVDGSSGNIYVADYEYSRISVGTILPTPTLTTQAATGISTSVSTAHGIVNPNGSATTVSFDYGTSPTLVGASSTSGTAIGSGTVALAVTGVASGLSPSTKYYFRAKATTADITRVGSILFFTTASSALVPIIAPGLTQSISDSGAAVSATVNPKGAATTVSFDYGLTTGYGTSTTSQDIGSGIVAVYASGSLTGLTPGTLYHYRVVSVSALGTFYGPDQTFTTQLEAGLFVVAAKNDIAFGIPNARFNAFGNPAINEQGHSAFQATVSAIPGTVVSVSAANNSGIWAEIGSSESALMVRTGTPAPGIASGIFATLSDPVFNNNDGIAFYGTVKTGTGGIVTANAGGIWAITSGTVNLVARAQSQAPGCAVGVTFTTFSQFVLPDQGGVVVLANLGGGAVTANNQGIWAVDTNGVLQLIVRKGDTQQINGASKVVSSLLIFAKTTASIGQSRSFNGPGDLMFKATFTDGSQAIEKVVFP